MEKKLLFGITIGGAAIAAFYFISKKKKNYATVDASVDGEQVEAEVVENETVKEKIEKAALKVADWVLKNKEYLEAAGSCVGLITSLFSLKNTVKPKTPKGMVTLDEKKFDEYVTGKVIRKSDKIIDIFLDGIVKNDGLVSTRYKDGVKIKSTVIYPKGEVA